MLRDQDPNEESNLELLSESETSWFVRIHLGLMDQMCKQLEPRPCQGLPRQRNRHQTHLVVLVVRHWLAVKLSPSSCKSELGLKGHTQ